MTKLLIAYISKLKDSIGERRAVYVSTGEMQLRIYDRRLFLRDGARHDMGCTGEAFGFDYTAPF